MNAHILHEFRQVNIVVATDNTINYQLLLHIQVAIDSERHT